MVTVADTLEDLAARCESATGPDRGLDGRIAYALGWRFNGLDDGVDDPDFDEWNNIGGHWAQPGGDFCPVWSAFNSEDYPDPPDYTASLDAAMTLYVEIPERVPSNPRLAAAEALRQRADHV